jgi:sulfur-oxidizing protein SoxX
MPHKQSLLAVSAAAAFTIASTAALAEMPELDLSGNAEAGKEIAMDRSRGNCIACHVLPGGESPGAIGPALVAMQTRYNSKQDLAQQIWDPTVANPEAVMPPFGKHGILSDKEFVDVVEYVWAQ